MPSPLRASLAGLILASLASVAGAQTQPGAPNTVGGPMAPGAAPHGMPEAYMRHWLDYRAAMLDARLAGLRAGLRLNADQEKLWGPFEAAVRNFAAMRTARMQKMLEGAARMESDEEGSDMGGPPLSPLDRLDMMATRMVDVGQALKGVADTAKPLYASLDDEQKRMFGVLSHEMMMMGRGHHGGDMGPPHRRDESEMGGPPARHGHDEEDMDSEDEE
jgi:hypothetical protein